MAIWQVATSERTTLGTLTAPGLAPSGEEVADEEWEVVEGRCTNLVIINYEQFDVMYS